MAIINVTANTNYEAIATAADDDYIIFDGVTLTITQTPTFKVRSITALGTGICELVNTSTSNMLLLSTTAGVSANLRCENAGLFRTRGNWITVATGNGSASQVVLSNLTIGGQTIDYPSYFRVETGNNTNQWEIWQAIPEDVAGWTANDLGFNEDHLRSGTVAVSAGGVVTGTGTAFDNNLHLSRHFRAAGHTTDYVILSVASATSMTLINRDGSAYNGGAIGAGASYVVRTGSAINPLEVGSGELGRWLFFNPLTNQVRTGDGTNGNVIPSGARVQVPNIHITSDPVTTTLSAAITGTGAAAISLTAGGGFPTSIAAYANNTSSVPTLLVRNTSTGAVERIAYTTRSANTLSATGMVRGVFQTVAQTFPIGSQATLIPHPFAIPGFGGFDLNPGGAIDLEITSLGARFLGFFTSQARSVRLIDVGVVGRSAAVGCSGDVEFNRVSGLMELRSIGNTIAPTLHGISGVAGALAFNNSVYSAMIQGVVLANQAALGLVNAQQAPAQINDLFCFYFRRTNAAGSATSIINIGNIYSSTVPFVDINRLRAVGCSVRLSGSAAFLRDLRYSDTCSSIGTIETIAFVATAQVGGGLVGCQTIAGGWPARDAMFNINADTKDLVLSNKTFSEVNGRASLRRLFSLAAGANLTISHWTVTNMRGTFSPQIPVNTVNVGAAYRRLDLRGYTSPLTGTGSGAFLAARSIVDVGIGPQPFWSSTTTTSQTNSLFDIQAIAVVTGGVSATAGNISVGPFSLQQSLTLYSGLSSTAYLTGDGRLYLFGASDQVVINSTFPLRGWSSFDVGGTITNEGVNTGTLTFEFRMSNWGVVPSGAWQSLTLANLESARAALSGYSTSVGINLQIRVSTAAVDTTRFLSLIRIPGTIDAAYNPAVSEVPITIVNAASGSTYRLYNNTTPLNPALIGRVAVSGSTASINAPTDYDGTVIPITLRIVDYLRNRISLNAAYTSSALSIPVSPSIDASITQTDRSIVDSYTHVSDLNRVRDAAKRWGEVNFDLGFPSLDVPILTVNGEILDFGSVNVVVTTSGSAFSVNTGTNTVTLRVNSVLSPTSKFNTIQTTGTITFAGGSDYAVTVVDSTGTRYPAVTIGGFPTANNSNGIAPAPRVAITNLRTNAVQTYVVSGATIAVKLSDVAALPTDDIRITTDTIGYRRPLDQTVKGDRTEAINFVFEPWVDAQNDEMVGLAPAAAIDFDLVEERLELPSGTVNFLGSLMRWEEVTAGPIFHLFPTNAVRRFNFIKARDGSAVVIVADNWTIAAKASAASSPIITDFTVIGESPTRDVFEYGLPSSVGGLTHRPNVNPAFLAPSSEVTVTAMGTNVITAAALDTSAANEIRTGLATSQNVTDAQTALTNLINALNNLSAAQVRSQVDAGLTAYDGATQTGLNAAQTALANLINALNNISTSQVRAQVDAGLTAYNGATRTDLNTAVAPLSTFNPATQSVTVGAINASVINAASIATGAINAAKIATDAIGPDEISSAAVTKITAGLATAQNVSDSQAAITTAINNKPNPDNTSIGQILNKVNQISIVGGLVEATIGNQTVTLNATQSEQLLRLFQRAGLAIGIPVDVSQDSITFDGLTINQTETNPTTVRLQRQP